MLLYCDGVSYETCEQLGMYASQSRTYSSTKNAAAKDGYWPTVVVVGYFPGCHCLL